ncbi:MAG: glycosyltransferase family 4 protein [Ignavibacteria bacterium]
MKILVLSFYFRPDLSAGSFRATALVEALRAQAPDARILVVTSLPNRYSSFAVDAPEFEDEAGVSVTRIALPSHQGGMLDQSKSFLSFAIRAWKRVRNEDIDVVFATSSRLMTAALGAWIAMRKGALLYLDIRDIFVDTIKDVLPRKAARIAHPLFALVERMTISRARSVNLVSGGFRQYFEQRYPRQRFTYFTNGIDDEFLCAAPTAASAIKTGGPLLVVYAGNLGEGQGLHGILPQLAKRTEGKLRFRIIGDGGRKARLLQGLADAGVTNVEILPPVSRDRLLEHYRAADVLFMHLNNHDAFEKVLPSKVFEYGALGKPIWAGVPGFAADFVRAEVDNAVVFPPCNADAALAALAGLVIREQPRPAFIRKFARAEICRAMAADILAAGRGGN